MNREREIVKASIYGIIGNVLLVAFKMAVGFMSHSIAIILDGVNNATDALSSIVTIVGTKLAGRRPDRHHPFGYGRVEYLTSVVIAIIILVAGFISLRESIDKIIHPGTPSYSAITITVIVVAILAKIAIGIMFKRFGDKTNSEALIASGIDSNYDAVLSAGTLVVAAAQNFWNLNIDGAVGLIISLVVLKAGFEVLGDALSPLIGGPEDKKLVDDITAYANSFPDVRGTYDVVLDTVNHTARQNGEPVELRRLEYDLLELLMRNRGAALYRDVMYERVWGGIPDTESLRTVDTHIARLRKKLGWMDKIETVYKIGYRLKKED